MILLCIIHFHDYIFNEDLLLLKKQESEYTLCIKRFVIQRWKIFCRVYYVITTRILIVVAFVTIYINSIIYLCQLYKQPLK